METAGIEKDNISAAREGYYPQRVFSSHLALRSELIRTRFRMWKNLCKQGNKYVPYMPKLILSHFPQALRH